MNNLKEILKAIKEGKTVQTLQEYEIFHDVWEDASIFMLNNPSNYLHFKWRIAPEVNEAWASVYKNKNGKLEVDICIHSSEEEALCTANIKDPNYVKTIDINKLLNGG
jgi:hypothetical protein